MTAICTQWAESVHNGLNLYTMAWICTQLSD